jgi:hypothetical protein
VRSEVSRFALTELVSFRLARVLLEPPRRPGDGDGIAERDPQPRLGVDRIACSRRLWGLGLHKTLLARSLPPIKVSVEVTLCVVEHQTSPTRVA